MTIYYAYKQQEVRPARLAAGAMDEPEDPDLPSPLRSDLSSTGWETFLEAVIRSGFAITGTWPMRTERSGRPRSIDANALSSSIVLVCRPRPSDAPVVTRREFLTTLKVELPTTLAMLHHATIHATIAPVDLAQAAIGLGMAIYTRYARVLDADGTLVRVRDALMLINRVLDETLAAQESAFDAETRWALAWFEQYGFGEGEYGVAETLVKAKNTSIERLVVSGMVEAKRGKVRLLAPDELPPHWDPAGDGRVAHWGAAHHLIRVLNDGGEPAAAALVTKLGSQADVIRDLAYRLYSICERTNRADAAVAYNTLIRRWGEMTRLAVAERQKRSEQSPIAWDS